MDNPFIRNESPLLSQKSNWPYTVYIFFLIIQIGLWIYQRGVIENTLQSSEYNLLVTIVHSCIAGSMVLYFLSRLKQYTNSSDRTFFIALWSVGMLVVISRWIINVDDSNLSGIQYFLTRSLLNFHLLLLGLIEFSRLNKYLAAFKFGPGRILILSFLVLILFGTFLLLLPAATHNELSFIDALFTSTSAVCVTGLIVVDTATAFTPFGQWIIIILIQLGGLGMMTLTSFFGFFFQGNFSYSSQIYIKDFVNSDQLSDLFKVVSKILFFTFLIEATGALIIYFSLPSDFLGSTSDRWFFAIFHSISAFCNAGFSTMTSGLYEFPVRYNYTLQLVIVFLIIIGGIGFTVIMHLYNALKQYIKRIRTPKRKRSVKLNQTYKFNLNTTIVIRTTLIILVISTILMFVLEYNYTLREHDGFGKFVGALFEAVTPRTAGFNSVDVTQMSFAAIILTILLMWIGASPGSTGGGIKTSTFALAVLNIISLAKGQDRVEFRNRHISTQSIKRAFAVISLSLVFIGISIFIVSFTDPDLGFLQLSFEAFSAFSTVGLSLGITGSLSPAGKIVMVLCMFIGRVGAITVLISIFRKVSSQKYQYPQEEILIS
ncbi:MAG: ATPase [Saprospiraceae bacterium]|nr:ATPase [Saprospiraceae bacterium]